MVKKTNSNAIKTTAANKRARDSGYPPTSTSEFIVRPISELSQNKMLTPDIEYVAHNPVELKVVDDIKAGSGDALDSLSDSLADQAKFRHINSWIDFLAEQNLDQDVELDSDSAAMLLYTLVEAKMQITYLVEKLANG